MLRFILFSVVTASIITAPIFALAEASPFKDTFKAMDKTTDKTPSFFDDFSAISIGTAFVTQPEFLGAETSETRVFPLVQGAYNIDGHQQIYLRGLELGYAYAYNENFQFGVDLTPRRGRGPEEDSRLTGLENIGTSIEVGPWVKLRWKGLRFQTNIRTDIAGEHDGVLATFKLSHKVEPIPGFRFTAYGQTEWASNAFMDTFFTVTPGEAAAGRPAFNAKSGFYQSALGGTFNHLLHKDIFLWVDAQFQFLHGDARKSSLSFNDTDFRGILGVGYTF